MRQNYIIRLDDACPTMDSAKWGQMEDILDKHGIKPIVGIIPNNEDPQQIIEPADTGFWEKVLSWQNKGWVIALHGYNHCYTSNGGMNGLNPLWSRSEFAGLTIDEQREKICKGVAIMQEHGINPKCFFAPSHTFDDNTLTALREESDIRIISDTIATRPYLLDDFILVPQFSGQCRTMLFPGLYTFCFHPNVMNDIDFEKVDSFLQKHHHAFISLDSLDFTSVRKKNLFDKLLSWGYFFQRKLRGIR